MTKFSQGQWHRLGETEAGYKPASLCVAYVLLQPVHRGCDLCSPGLPVVLSQGAVQVPFQLVTQLRRGAQSVSRCSHLPPAPRCLQIPTSWRQDTGMTQMGCCELTGRAELTVGLRMTRLRLCLIGAAFNLDLNSDCKMKFDTSSGEHI